ncbi:MAG TPA: alpha/beta hydrolase [Candidatus Lustribacter sp.]|nr:alpha/beta hydrolase [Candidatus Lustribacter sp.]
MFTAVRTWLRAPAAASAAALALLGAACGSAPGGPTDPTTTGLALQHLVATRDYLPGLAADLYLPDLVRVAPVVVMVPGGAWVAADRSGLGPLAERLAADGIVVVNATHRPARDGVRFPEPLQDVLCSVGFAVRQAVTAGIEPGPVVVLGHSSGAHLAALAALAPDRFRGACPYPDMLGDALVGLGGVYDVSELAEVAEPLFGVGPEDDPTAWRDGNPMTWVRQRPSLPVFLGYGDADPLAPAPFTRAFAGALQAGGHPVHVEVVAGADHPGMYDSAYVAEALRAWIAALPAPTTRAGSDTGASVRVSDSVPPTLSHLPRRHGAG